ncbi:hypothetical protein Tco_1393851 [Tanacetum coccineum]
MEIYSCEFCGGSPHPGFDCQTGNIPVYEQGLCYNQNFGYDQPSYYSPSPPQQFYCCEVRGGPQYSSDCETRNPLVYEPNPCNNYDLPYIDQPPQYHIDHSSPHDLDLKKCIDDLKLQMNEIMDLIREKYQIHEPPVSFDEPEGSDDDTEMIFDEEQFSRQYITALVPPASLACIPLPLFLPTIDKEMSKPDISFIEPLGNLTMGDEEISIIPEGEINEFKTSYASDLVPIPRESEVTMSSVDEPFSMALDTPPSPYLVVLGDEKIDLLFRDDLDTLSIRDREIDFNPCRLERLLADDLILIPREFEDSISSVDHICDSSVVAINDPQFKIVTPLPIFQAKICLREVERFDPFLSLTRSGETK